MHLPVAKIRVPLFHTCEGSVTPLRRLNAANVDAKQESFED